LEFSPIFQQATGMPRDGEPKHGQRIKLEPKEDGRQVPILDSEGREPRAKDGSLREWRSEGEDKEEAKELIQAFFPGESREEEEGWIHRSEAGAVMARTEGRSLWVNAAIEKALKANRKSKQNRAAKPLKARRAGKSEEAEEEGTGRGGEVEDEKVEGPGYRRPDEEEGFFLPGTNAKEMEKLIKSLKMTAASYKVTGKEPNTVMTFKPFGCDGKLKKRGKASSVIVIHYGGGVGKTLMQGTNPSSDWGAGLKFSIEKIRRNEKVNREGIEKHVERLTGRKSTGLWPGAARESQRIRNPQYATAGMHKRWEQNEESDEEEEQGESQKKSKRRKGEAGENQREDEESDEEEEQGESQKKSKRRKGEAGENQREEGKEETQSSSSESSSSSGAMKSKSSSERGNTIKRESSKKSGGATEMEASEREGETESSSGEAKPGKELMRKWETVMKPLMIKEDMRKAASILAACIDMASDIGPSVASMIKTQAMAAAQELVGTHRAQEVMKGLAEINETMSPLKNTMKRKRATPIKKLTGKLEAEAQKIKKGIKKCQEKIQVLERTKTDKKKKKKKAQRRLSMSKRNRSKERSRSRNRDTRSRDRDRKRQSRSRDRDRRRRHRDMREGSRSRGRRRDSEEQEDRDSTEAEESPRKVKVERGGVKPPRQGGASSVRV
jgi:hypothetical protein